MKTIRMVCVLLCVAGLSNADIFYVSPTGNDSDNGSKENPWKTIGYAANSVKAGDSVFIMAGTYKEHVVFQATGLSGKTINFIGNHTQEVILCGSLEFAQGISHMYIGNITIKNFPFWGVSLRGDNHFITLNNLHVQEGECGIHFTYGRQGQPPFEGPVSHITVRDSLIKDSVYTGIDGTPGPCNSMKFINCEVSGCGMNGSAYYSSDGIAIERGEDILVEGCYIHNNSGDGIDLNSRNRLGYVQGIQVKRNRVIDNYLTGIKIWAGGSMINNIVMGQGNTPVFIGAYPGIYEFINNTIAYNMYDASFSIRNYAFVASYPDDATGISAEIDLTLVNNIFAFNTGPRVGSPTGIYLGEGVHLVKEGFNLFWSRKDGEIQAEFIEGDSWFSRSQIINGEWAAASGEGDGDICSNPLFLSTWPEPNVRLKAGSPALDKGTEEVSPSVDVICMKRPGGLGVDVGAFEMFSVLDPYCGNNKKGRIRR